MRSLGSRTVLAASFALLLAAGLVFGRGRQETKLALSPVAGAVSCLVGRGGNIGVSAGKDGVLIVDDQFLDLAPAIEAELAKLGHGSPRFLVNTHWHGDHTGANEHFGKQALVVAQTNVRRRLAREPQMGAGVAEKELPAAALPVVTYDESAALHFNGEEIRLVHLPSAHTDGDTVVWFVGSNVVHMGDLYFQVGYPFIDRESGGSIQGLIAGVKQVLALVPKDARFVPGHGDVTGRDGLEAYLAMLETITERVRRGLAEGSSVEDMLEGGITQDFDARWGHFAFVPPKSFVETVAACLAK